MALGTRSKHACSVGLGVVVLMFFMVSSAHGGQVSVSNVSHTAACRNSLGETHALFVPRGHSLREFRWVHFPKAGTSFAMLLYHYACPDIPPDAKFDELSANGMAIPEFEKQYPYAEWCKQGMFLEPRAGHTPIRRTEFAQHPGAPFVTMFRDPRKRLFSAYHNYKHSNGLDPQERARLLATVKTIKDFVKFPGIAGCQTKMLLGYNCAAQVPITEEMIQKAIEIVKESFAFIGDTDDWNKSVCLFHAMFGGKMYATSFQNMRNTAARPGGAGYNKSAAEEAISIEDDPADWRIYQAAMEVYWQNRAKFFEPEYVE